LTNQNKNVLIGLFLKIKKVMPKKTSKKKINSSKLDLYKKTQKLKPNNSRKSFDDVLTSKTKKVQLSQIMSGITAALDGMTLDKFIFQMKQNKMLESHAPLMNSLLLSEDSNSITNKVFKNVIESVNTLPKHSYTRKYLIHEFGKDLDAKETCKVFDISYF
jgi:hypothetical protein